MQPVLCSESLVLLRDVLEDIDVGKIEVFFADVQDLANEVRLSRLRQRQRRALLMHAQLSEAEVDELITGLGVETDTALELSGRADLLVNVLEASMRDCFGLVVLQQVRIV